MPFVPVSFAVAWMAIQVQAPPPPAGSARVIAEELPVHEAASSSSEAIRTLKREQAVIVDIRVAGAGGRWCGIRSEAKREAGGYVLCSLLEQVGSQTKAPQYTPIAEAPGGTGGGEPTARPADPPPAPEAWMDALGFDGRQREHAMTLLETSGVSGCRGSLATLFQNLGITDAGSSENISQLLENTCGVEAGVFIPGDGRAPAMALSFVDWMARTKEPARTLQAGRVGAVLDPCIRKCQSFWRGFSDLLNPEQKKRAQSDPWFLFLWSSPESQPEMIVFGDVTRHMRRSGISPPARR